MKKKGGRAGSPGLPYPDRAWPERDTSTPRKVRVLIESSNAGVAWAEESILADAGYDVAVCWGPACGETNAKCPLIAGKPCPLVSDADVVVQSFRRQDYDTFPILDAVRKNASDTPVCVELAAPSRDGYGDALDGCVILETPVTRRRLVEAVSQAFIR